MKIIKLAFKEDCPHCGYKNLINPEKIWLECENCGGGWESFMHTKKIEDPRVFDNPPVPQGDDRRIRN